MKTRYIYTLLAGILLLVSSSSFAQVQVLDVKENFQEKDQWCWAACSKAVLDYYGKSVTQCQIAEYTRTVSTWNNFGNVPCCTDASQGCNYWNYNWGYPGSIEDILSHWGVQDKTWGKALSLKDINTEIGNGRPFVIRWGWYSGGGHFVVGRGVSGNTVYYMNPWPGEGLKFSDYNWVVDDGNHAWTHTNTMVTNPSTQSIQVNLTAPANNGTYTAPAAINLAANASVNTGSITKVEFYNGNTLIATDNTFPYNYSWVNVVAGTYSITAKAYDNLNASKTSAAVSVTVNAPINQFPYVSITSPANNAGFAAPASITLSADASDSDGSISKVEFYNGTSLLGTDNTSPYSFIWNNSTAGNYIITAKATDNKGAVSTSSAISVVVFNVVTQSPYGGTPWAIPGTIQAENYDLGGDGPAYHDADYWNQGNAYRSEGVDIEATSDSGEGFNVGWTVAGEYLEYTVNVTAQGQYDFSMRVASAMAGKSFHIEMDGQNVTGSISVPNTGGWQNWQTVTIKNITLSQGNKIMRVAMDTDGFNLNHVSVLSSTVNTDPVVNITSPSNNTSYTAPAEIIINANASDSDGTVSKVEFFYNGTKIEEDASSPYSITWSNVAAGTYSITAKAYDNLNASKTSTAVNVIVNAPVNQFRFVSMTSPANFSEFSVPTNITLTADASDIDGSISKVEFYIGTSLIGTDNTFPYTYVWNNINAGTYTIHAKATDNMGAVSSSSAITFVVRDVVTQTPYGGTPWIIPGTIQAENYDLGGESIAFHDADASNNGNAFRSEGVDIEATSDSGGGFNVGWTAAGEYLEYTVNVTAPGPHDFSMRVATPMAGKSFHIEMDGVNVTGAISVPNTGGWQNWQTATISNITLTQGQKIMRVVMDTDGLNLNYVSVSAANVNVGPIVNISTPSNNTNFTAPAAIIINANASDSDGISKVEFFFNGNKIGEDATSPYSITWSNVAAGTYSITAKAYDNLNGSATSAAVNVTVNAPANKLPSVNITSPTNNTSFVAPASIAFTVDVSDSDGSISKVEFYNGSSLIGTSSASPFNFTWVNVAAGTYSITAKTYDNQNASNSSAVISVIVSQSITCAAPQWNASVGYGGGDIIQYAGIKYKANWWTMNQRPDQNNGPQGSGQPWTSLGACTSKFGYIVDAEPKTISMTPNPIENASIVTLNLLEDDAVDIFIVDQMGRKVYTIYNGNISSGIRNFELNNLSVSPGIYQLIMIGEKGNLNVKLIKN